MIARFNQKMEENPRMRLFALRQKGSVADYVNEFEELTTIVTGVEEENLENVFYLGLKPEMHEVVKMQKPRGLSALFSTVISMEDSIFCKSMAEAANPFRRSGFLCVLLPNIIHKGIGAQVRVQRALNHQHRPVYKLNRAKARARTQSHRGKQMEEEITVGC
ncbi:unnamed protein product [Microthlaspi erraticum]|uniref:Retrotransposon gag domain-containing protein n=1 Tax=Microthlaspi erraticum TaxID=1685480 RepID=A0A6D2IX65_9BRAS|nr:unnamed protein product [Microthlaspi erraticum]